MRTVSFEREVSVKVVIELSMAELDRLIQISEHHYDGVCKAASATCDSGWTKNGFLRIAKMFHDPNAGNVMLCVGNYDLQTLCKMTEMEHPLTGSSKMGLHFQLVKILNESGAEYKRVTDLLEPK